MASQRASDTEHLTELSRPGGIRGTAAGPAGRRLGQLLANHGAITPQQLEQALADQARSHDGLGAILVRLGFISEEQLALCLSEVYGIPGVVLPDAIDPEILNLVPERIARKHDAIPVERQNGALTLAMADPTNLPTLDDVAFVTGLRVLPAVAPLSAIRRAIEQSYESEALGEVSGEIAELEVVDGEHLSGPVDLMELRSSADQAPVVRIVNTVLAEAIRRRASDIHFEPSTAALRIRYRIDGVLHESPSLPKRLEPGIISRLKIMANLDIAERRLPQDGRVKLQYNSREVDFRVNTLPMMYGEGVSMRILDRQALRLDLSHLGFEPRDLAELQKAIAASHGMLVITGPTGSGKTTTLYSALHSLDAMSLNIMTVEDPVEYQLERVNQVPVNEEIGRSFTAVLRSFLRHDPDVILVGEMRDLETAQIAVRAALTGHLVLSTLHTNDAPTTVARLRDMEVAQFFIASTLRLVVAQRLIRKVCSGCRESYEVDETSLAAYGHVPAGSGRRVLARGRGCRSCHFTGMRGRTALFEVMPITEEIRDLITANAATGQIRQLARDQGMRTLREAALLKVLAGTVALDELLRVTSD